MLRTISTWNRRQWNVLWKKQPQTLLFRSLFDRIELDNWQVQLLLSRYFSEKFYFIRNKMISFQKLTVFYYRNRLLDSGIYRVKVIFRITFAKKKLCISFSLRTFSYISKHTFTHTYIVYNKLTLKTWILSVRCLSRPLTLNLLNGVIEIILFCFVICKIR